MVYAPTAEEIAEMKKKQVLVRIIQDNQHLTVNQLSDLTGYSKGWIRQLINIFEIEVNSAKQQRIEVIKGNPNLNAQELSKKLGVCKKTIYELRQEAKVTLPKTPVKKEEKKILVFKETKPKPIDRASFTRYSNRNFTNMYLD